ncbi:hypothetical protein RHMOL_Rhmol07G0265100 [Rhododendron molle]|uniref:Uncharacterized protein n=1 Tax=Rhododendron molle TaxID=49168 RepID=A0ACC0N714_RHOML|nr:hypothetical protein RHMOL_Rhmol07G0265100 [Rhododendron molle]
MCFLLPEVDYNGGLITGEDVVSSGGVGSGEARLWRHMVMVMEGGLRQCWKLWLEVLRHDRGWGRRGRVYNIFLAYSGDGGRVETVMDAVDERKRIACARSCRGKAIGSVW